MAKNMKKKSIQKLPPMLLCSLRNLTKIIFLLYQKIKEKDRDYQDFSTLLMENVYQ